MDVLSRHFPLGLPSYRGKEPSWGIWIYVLKIYIEKYKDIFIYLFSYTKLRDLFQLRRRRHVGTQRIF